MYVPCHFRNGQKPPRWAARAPDSGPSARVTAAECHAAWPCVTHIHTQGGAWPQTHTWRQHTASTLARVCQAARPRPAPAPQGDSWLATRWAIGVTLRPAGARGSWLAFRVWVQGHRCRPVGSPCVRGSPCHAVSVCPGSALQKRPGGHLQGRTADTPPTQARIPGQGSYRNPIGSGAGGQKWLLRGVRWVGEGPIPRGPSENGVSPQAQASPPASRCGGLRAS